MTRKALIDALGVWRHSIVRSIYHKKVFVDDADRKNFLDRL